MYYVLLVKCFSKCFSQLWRSCKAAVQIWSYKTDTWTAAHCFMVLSKPLPCSSLLKPAMCVWLADSFMSHCLTTAVSAVFEQTPKDVEKPVGLLFVELQLCVTWGECGHMKAVILKHPYDFKLINVRKSWLCNDAMLFCNNGQLSFFYCILISIHFPFTLFRLNVCRSFFVFYN